LNAKIRAACDYLIYSESNISEIADRLGFTNVHNFSRAFRKATGQSPSAYRSGKTELPPVP
jgi:AraC family transcriptional regulator of arabinose operon